MSYLASLPKSILLLGFTLVVFLLQVLPLPGVILMTFAAPFWSIITINLAFILMIVEVKTGRLPPWMIVAPILYFGGFFVMAAISHLQSTKCMDEITTQNQSIRIPFDPNKQALVFTEGALFYNCDYPTTVLVQSFGLPVAYRAISHGNIFLRIAKHLAVRIERIPADIHYPWSQEFSLDKEAGIMRVPIFGGGPIPGICLASRAEDPVLPVFTVTVRQSVEKNWLMTKHLEHILVTDPDGHSFQLSGAHIESLGWLPLPVMGYFLDSSAPAWTNVSGFMQLDKSAISGQDVFVQALGLHRQAPQAPTN
jgi:hypothetical protein